MYADRRHGSSRVHPNISCQQDFFDLVEHIIVETTTTHSGGDPLSNNLARTTETAANPLKETSHQLRVSTPSSMAGSTM